MADPLVAARAGPLVAAMVFPRAVLLAASMGDLLVALLAVPKACPWAEQTDVRKAALRAGLKDDL